MPRHVCSLYFGTLTLGGAGSGRNRTPDAPASPLQDAVIQTWLTPQEVSAEPHVEPPEPLLWLRLLTLLGCCVRTRAEPSLCTTCTLKTSAYPWDTCKEVYGASNWKY